MTATPLTLTTVLCPRCHTSVYRHPDLGWIELRAGERHDALLCAARHSVRALLAEEEPWADIDT